MSVLTTLQKSNKGSVGAATRSPYLRLVHIELQSASASGGGAPFGVAFTAEEEEEFMAMARSEGFYERFASSVAPSIFGNVGTPGERLTDTNH